MKLASLPRPWPVLLHCICRFLAVRPEGANHQRMRNPSGELSIDSVADGAVLLTGLTVACAVNSLIALTPVE